MPDVVSPPPAPTLDDCADEPIHIPGAIQPHGALLVFEAGRLAAWSDNVSAMLGARPVAGATADEIGLDASLSVGLDALLAEPSAGIGPPSPLSEQAMLAATRYTRTVHDYDGRTLVEFERTAEDMLRTNLAGRAFSLVKGTATQAQLLQQCCAEIRKWTGFDRVMAYVFRHDDSGEVVAESRSDRIDSFLDMRFPASDIPAQARRLYVLSTLRFIPDVDYPPVALRAPAGQRPVDLSYVALRSVSPIHVEYLRNMGVQASMSVSIVLDGRLWGLFACHHNKPLAVGPATRQACDMLAHFASSRIQALRSEVLAARMDEAAGLSARLVGDYAGADDALHYFASIEGELREALGAEGLVVAHQGKVLAFGGVPQDTAVAIAAHFADAARPPGPVDDREAWPEALRARLGDWVGALSIDFDTAARGRVIALQREQEMHVKWSGEPTKTYRTGPHGPRLTPRGSFAEWRETVRGRSAPWSDASVRIARNLEHELLRITATRQAELEEARRHLLAMLGHDLRDPLNAIRMAAGVLQRTGEGAQGVATRIENSSGRMQRLISQVLDFSRAEAGLPMLGDPVEFDVAALVRDLIDESRMGHPGVAIVGDLQQPLPRRGDAARLAQAVNNLLSNARHYAEPGSAIEVQLRESGGGVRLRIANVSPPIPDATAAALFEPLKRIERQSVNRSGLGLGLYIAHRIARSMEGDLHYTHEDGRVVFTLALP